MISFAVKAAAGVRDHLKKVEKNIKFGTAVGLTKTAKAAQAEVFKALPATFTIRSPWWKQSMRFGIRVKPARPHDPVSEVRTNADWLEPHERGGPKPKRTVTSRFAIPTKEIRRLKHHKITKAKKPRALFRTFRIETQRRGAALLQRRGRGRRMTAGGRLDRNLRIVYYLSERVKLKRASAFHDPIERVVTKRGGDIMLDEITKALETMR